MKIYYEQFSQFLSKSLCQFYFVYGHPETLVQDIRYQIRKKAIDSGYLSEKFYIDKDLNLDSLFLSIQTENLFQNKRLLELIILEDTFPKNLVNFSIEFLKQPSPNIICLIKASRLQNLTKSKWLNTLEKEGVIITIYPLKASQFLAWIKSKCHQLKLTISNEGFIAIIQYAQEDIYIAYQIIVKLYLTYGKNLITLENIQSIVYEQSDGEPLELLNNLLHQDLTKAIVALRTLRESSLELPIIIWYLSQEFHKLAHLSYLSGIGLPLDDTIQKYTPIFKQQSFYKKYATHFSAQSWHIFLSKLLQIDRICKGIVLGNPWRELEILLLNVHKQYPLLLSNPPLLF